MKGSLSYFERFLCNEHLPVHPPSIIFSITQIRNLTKVKLLPQHSYLAGNLVFNDNDQYKGEIICSMLPVPQPRTQALFNREKYGLIQIFYTDQLQIEQARSTLST